MFLEGNHSDLIRSIEAIGASFAIYEYNNEKNLFILLTCNSLYEELLGRTIHNSLDKDLSTLFPRYLEKPLRDIMFESRTKKEIREIELVIEYKNEVRWWRFIISPVMNDNNECVRIINTCIEITDKKQLEKDLDLTHKRYKAVVDAAYDGIIVINEDQNINMINDSAQYIFGLENKDVIGSPLSDLMPKKYRHKHPEYVDTFSKSEVDSRPMQVRAPVRGLRSDGTEFPIEVTISKIHVGSETEMTAVVRDISERAQLVEELSKAAKEDSLTGIFNRRHFTSLLQVEIERSDRFEHMFSMVMFDIDNFKKVNDTYGHDCGDNVIMSIVELVNDNKRHIDSFARWGGEEFMVLLPETSAEEAYLWSEKIRGIIADNVFKYEDEKFKVTCSFGVISQNKNIKDLDVLLKDIDVKLYSAKDNGRNCVVK